MKSYKSSFLYILISLFFLGCDVYEDGFDTSSVNIDECAESGGICQETGVNASGLELYIEGVNPIQPLAASPNCDGDNTKYCFDISGKCNAGGRPISKIEVTQLLQISNQRNRAFTVRNEPIKCERGRFYLQLEVNRIPCTRYRATLELTSESTTGEVFNNAARAVKQIDVFAPNDPSC